MKKVFEAPKIDLVVIATNDIMNLQSSESTQGEFLDYNDLITSVLP
ncbi:MAG: hypothetical protein ACI3XQ_06660 [Eubacteriales bacterium]